MISVERRAGVSRPWKGRGRRRRGGQRGRAVEQCSPPWIVERYRRGRRLDRAGGWYPPLRCDAQSRPHRAGGPV